MNYIDEVYNIFDNKIQFFLDIYYIIAIKQLQFYAVFLSILLGQAKDYFIYNINQNQIFAKIFIKKKIKFDIKVNKA